MKNLLFTLAFLCFFLGTLSAQIDSTSNVKRTAYPYKFSIVEITVYDNMDYAPLSEANLSFVKDDKEVTYFQTKKDGKCNIKLEEGKYLVYATHPHYYTSKIHLTVKGGQAIKPKIKLTEIKKTTDIESGVAIPKLYGFWKVVYIDDGKKRIEQPKQIGESGIGFSELREHQLGLGSFFYNDGCKNFKGPTFRHQGNGKIEVFVDLIEAYDVGCLENNHNPELVKVAPKLFKGFQVSFINDDEIITKNDSIEIRLARTPSRFCTEKGIVIGKICNAANIPLEKVQIRSMKDGTFNSIYTKKDGTFRLRLTEGKHQLRAYHQDYEGETIDIEIKKNETIEQTINLTELAAPIPEEKAIPKLYGFWRVIHVDYGESKIKQLKQNRKSGIGFFKLKEHKKGMGELVFNDGCNDGGGPLFEHLGNGEIEMPISRMTKTTIGCKEYNEEIDKIILKLTSRFNASFPQDDEMILKNDSIEVWLERVK